MNGRRFALLLFVAFASACNDDVDEDAPVDTCSTEHVIDDVDDGIDAESTASTPAPADLSY